MAEMMVLMLGMVTPLGRLIEGLSQLDAVLSTEHITSHPIPCSSTTGVPWEASTQKACSRWMS